MFKSYIDILLYILVVLDAVFGLDISSIFGAYYINNLSFTVLKTISANLQGTALPI